MKNNKYSLKLIQLINKQKILFCIGAFIIIMLLITALISSNNSESKTGVSNKNPQSQSLDQTIPGTTVTPDLSASNENLPLTTRFIYFIQSFFKPSNGPSQTNQYGYTAGKNSKATGANSTSNISNQQNPGSNPSNQSGGASGGGGNGGSGSSGNNLGVSPGQATPTPVTDIQIVFIDESGGYWTYVPSVPPPINVTWMRYINHQDHYAIDYPSDWKMIKSNYNGHEAVTLYMPDSSGSIDKPSIAFVGWQANFLGSAAKYTGSITLNGVPGTIYTNGPLGLSSAAAVFQYQYGFFALGGSTTTPEFIYVFDHMLRSIDFDIQ